jgi:hypothetical protein
MSKCRPQRHLLFLLRPQPRRPSVTPSDYTQQGRTDRHKQNKEPKRERHAVPVEATANHRASAPLAPQVSHCLHVAEQNDRIAAPSARNSALLQNETE